MPANIREKSKPFVNLCFFRAVDTSVLSLEELLLFIQSNGDGSFRWPRKPRSVVRRAQRSRLHSKRPENNVYDRTIPSVRSTAPRFGMRPEASPTVYCTPDADSSSPSVSDDNVKLKTPSLLDLDTTNTAKSLVPTLSFSCRPGWDRNKKNTGISTVAIKNEAPTVKAAPLAEAGQSSSVRPQVLGTVSFKQTSQEDIDAFLKKFLGREEAEGQKKEEKSTTGVPVYPCTV